MRSRTALRLGDAAKTLDMLVVLDGVLTAEVLMVKFVTVGGGLFATCLFRATGGLATGRTYEDCPN